MHCTSEKRKKQTSDIFCYGWCVSGVASLTVISEAKKKKIMIPCLIQVARFFPFSWDFIPWETEQWSLHQHSVHIVLIGVRTVAVVRCCRQKCHRGRNYKEVKASDSLYVNKSSGKKTTVWCCNLSALTTPSSHSVWISVSYFKRLCRL